jgi:hypothetical protein
MDPQSPNLATRLRRAGVDQNIAALLVAALDVELGVDRLRDDDLSAARHVTDSIEAAARSAGCAAVSRVVFEVLELLGERPDLRTRLARPPEPAHA